MRLIEVLSDYEVKRLSRVPALSDADRRHYFKLDDTVTALVKRAKNVNNKVGLLLSYGYFKASGKFYSQKVFKPADVRIAAKILGVDPFKRF